MKWLKAANDPVNFYMSLMWAGGLIALMALILSGFASMPLCETRNPSNFLGEAPKTHF
jgi:hypothetical protein